MKHQNLDKGFANGVREFKKNFSRGGEMKLATPLSIWETLSHSSDSLLLGLLWIMRRNTLVLDSFSSRADLDAHALPIPWTLGAGSTYMPILFQEQ